MKSLEIHQATICDRVPGVVLSQSAQFRQIRSGTHALMFFQNMFSTLSRMYRRMFHSKSADELSWNWSWYKNRLSAARPPSRRPLHRTPPLRPPRAPIAASPVAPPIAGICCALALIGGLMEVCFHKTHIRGSAFLYFSGVRGAEGRTGGLVGARRMAGGAIIIWCCLSLCFCGKCCPSPFYMRARS